MSEQTVERRVYSIQEVAEMLGISRDLVNDMIREKQIRSLKAGNRRLIPVTAFEEYLASAE